MISIDLQNPPASTLRNELDQALQLQADIAAAVDRAKAEVAAAQRNVANRQRFLADRRAARARYRADEIAAGRVPMMKLADIGDLIVDRGIETLLAESRAALAFIEYDSFRIAELTSSLKRSLETDGDRPLCSGDGDLEALAQNFYHHGDLPT